MALPQMLSAPQRLASCEAHRPAGREWGTRTSAFLPPGSAFVSTVLFAPIPATAHVAWAELGIVLDDTHCDECGRGLTFDSWGNRWCGQCDPFTEERLLDADTHELSSSA